MGNDPGVKKRCVFFLGGYEPIPPERQRERYIRELERSGRIWSATTEVGPLELSPDRLVGTWRIAASGPNWSTDAAYHSLLWHDIVIADFARPTWKRLWLAVRAFGDFILTGTAFRYFRVNWRYGLFFFYPVILLLSFAVAAAYAASLPARARHAVALAVGAAGRDRDLRRPDGLAGPIPAARLHDGRLDFRA